MAESKMRMLANYLGLILCLSSSFIDCQESDGSIKYGRLTLPYDPCQVVRCGFGTVCKSISGTAKCVPPVPSSTSPIRPRECPSICPAIYQPVCGSDGKQYSNGCQLGVAACQQNKPIKQVPCESITTTKASLCRAGCPKIAAPVCGSDGETYANECLLNQAKCNGKDVELCHMGKCNPPICPDELEY